MASTLNVPVDAPFLEPFAKKRAGAAVAAGATTAAAAAAISSSAATTLVEEVGDELESDLLTNDVSCQDIAQFFEGRYIFLTGATGFVGKVRPCRRCGHSCCRDAHSFMFSSIILDFMMKRG